MWEMQGSLGKPHHLFSSFSSLFPECCFVELSRCNFPENLEKTENNAAFSIKINLFWPCLVSEPTLVKDTWRAFGASLDTSSSSVLIGCLRSLLLALSLGLSTHPNLRDSKPICMLTNSVLSVDKWSDIWLSLLLDSTRPIGHVPSVLVFCG